MNLVKRLNGDTEKKMIDLDDAIKSALKNKDKSALTGYRSLKAKVMNKLTEPGRGMGKALTDEEMLALVRKEARERAEANEYLDSSRDEYRENAHIYQLLEALLPPQLSEEEMDGVIRKTMDELKPSGLKEIGRVMAVLKAVPGLDMGAASAKVKALLQEQTG